MLLEQLSVVCSPANSTVSYEPDLHILSVFSAEERSD